MSQVFSMATVVAAVAGAAGGVIANLVEGQVAQRLEYIGQVSVWPKEWSIVYVDEDGRAVEPSASEEKVFGAHYAVNVRFFNRKRMATGFRDVRVEFTLEGDREPLRHFPDDPDRPTADGGDGSVEYEKADLINLPSREFVLQKLRGLPGAEDARRIRGCKKVEFVGVLPSGKERRVNLASSK